jgi:hypothetical protein
MQETVSLYFLVNNYFATIFAADIKLSENL